MLGLGCILFPQRLRLSWKVDECKPLPVVIHAHHPPQALQLVLAQHRLAAGSFTTNPLEPRSEHDYTGTGSIS
jgi:hypothetical protein